jgi:hypothetical protein
LQLPNMKRYDVWVFKYLRSDFIFGLSFNLLVVSELGKCCRQVYLSALFGLFSAESHFNFSQIFTHHVKCEYSRTQIVATNKILVLEEGANTEGLCIFDFDLQVNLPPRVLATLIENFCAKDCMGVDLKLNIRINFTNPV